jgi:hypothetical protein
MSVFTIRNKFLDVYDPFWLCRVLALKAGTVVILLFLCNTFLSVPQSPTLYMMTTLFGVLFSELLPSTSRWSKFGIYLSVIILMSMGSIFYGLLSYFKISLFLFLMVFTYIVLRFMVKSAAAAPLPILILTWGLIQLEGGGATNFTAVANNLLYYFEFGLMGIITIAFFPDFTQHIFKSAFIRVLESNARHVGDPNYRNSNPVVLAALYIMRTKLGQLPETYKNLYESIVMFQAEYMRPHHLTPDEQTQAKHILNELAQAVSNQSQFLDRQNLLQAESEPEFPVRSALHRLINSYNQCLA